MVMVKFDQILHQADHRMDLGSASAQNALITLKSDQILYQADHRMDLGSASVQNVLIMLKSDQIFIRQIAGWICDLPLHTKLR